MKVSVEWHSAACEDLAALYLHSNKVARESLQRAVYDLDELLRVNPSAKGEFVYAGQLPVEVLEKLRDRMGFYPEVIRRVRFGPLEALFTGHA